MNKRTRNILVAALVAVVVVVAALAWSAWRRGVTGNETKPAASASVKHDDGISEAVSKKAGETVASFETNARSWGVPMFDQASAQKMSIGDAIKYWRVADDGGFPAREAALKQMVNTDVVKLNDPNGVDTSWAGTDLYSGYADYWAKQLYTIGVNVVPDSLKVTKLQKNSDGTLNAVVSVRQQVVVYSPPSKDELPNGSWVFSPSIAYYDSEDTLKLNSRGDQVVQLPNGNLSGSWFLAPLTNGFKIADTGFTGLSGANEHSNQSVTYQGDDFRNVQTGLYPDPLFVGSSDTNQLPGAEATGSSSASLSPGQLPPVN